MGSDFLFIIKFSIDNRPEDWDRLEQKYDESGAYKQGYIQSKTKSDASDD